MFYTHIQIPPSSNWDPAVGPQVMAGCRLSKGGRLRQSIDVIARRQAAWARICQDAIHNSEKATGL